MDGFPRHPSQDIAGRAQLAAGQDPKVVLFGCSDSRVAAEIIFDQGLGDMFVVRTAGHVIDLAVLGSLEYAITVLGVPLIAILGHDSCGAVQASLSALDEGSMLGGYIRDLVVRVIPSILRGRCEAMIRVDEFVACHVQETGAKLMERSQVIAEAVRQNKAAIVFLMYRLTDGRVELRGHIGDIGE
ncbi:carbonic anhydrase [Mycobacteroides abscessus]|uniref:carbonic anhydrase n=1 Tax=Mycobacteroides abscessus TaxID=36809 RepID=UPI000C25C6FC|nr:carbonic anhydrase [Mycobacteroides abscessus]MDM1888415.1 carbonic anhydrase [Mycobacteroides abscessus]MDM1893163.1 carbonic anhydrase [Mycobacteroides abscessus]MDO3110963.1 carbonic anhydrase [Mycobacteroides abscessus subsp. abscessus]